jgi:tRNA-2-methylthio-N6-dimethylallyladenosine synthase
MRRSYRQGKFLRILEQVRAAIPDAAITTDIIVGFPGETEDDLEQTLRLVDEVGFDDAYTFQYSVREGTPAVRLKNHIAHPVAADRLRRLIEKVRLNVRRKNIARVGETHEVLVERPAKRGGLMLGRTRTNHLVLLDLPPGSAGEYHTVQLTGTTGSTFIGSVVLPALAVL